MSLEYNKLTTLQKNNLKAEAVSKNITGALSVVHQYEYYQGLLDSGVIDKMPYYLDDDKVLMNAKLIEITSPLVVESAEKVNHNQHARVKRVKDYLFKMLATSKCLWLTLTFTDDVLKNNEPETLRQYVFRFLKKHSPYYMANIDYGPLHDRPHYHAIILCDYISAKAWPYGFSKIKPIGTDDKDIKKLSTYISKLTNHCFKDSVKNNRMIFSRSMPIISHHYWLKNKIDDLKNKIDKLEKKNI